jgi:hypothetical protein
MIGNHGDTTMRTKSKIALSFMVVLSAASMSLTPHAFAQNGHLDRADYVTDSQKINGDQRRNAIRGKHSDELGTGSRWIDNPASPGG